MAPSKRENQDLNSGLSQNNTILPPFQDKFSCQSQDSVIESDFFAKIINFGQFLKS